MELIPKNQGAEYYRGFLTQQGRSIYDRIASQLLREDYTGATQFMAIDPKTAFADCFAAYKAVRNDHPEFFFLGTHVQCGLCGEAGTIEYEMLYPVEMIERIRRQLRKGIYRIVRGTAYLDVVSREKAVYERIARTVVYSNHNDARDHNVVGPILLSSGVCEGQNALLLLCFRRIGIPCIKVTGRITEGSTRHCWTIAWINGTPVHCDVTCDGSDEGSDSVVRFDYFNLSDEQIALDHSDFKGEHIPVCASDRFSYYRYHDLCVHSFQNLCSRLKTDAAAGVSPILIHFSYSPASGDHLEETKRAFSAEGIGGKHMLDFHPTLKNLAVKKL